MRTDLEMLIEIINNFFGCDAAYYDVNPYDLACHLIDHGVTVTDTNVGKWIPVTERLPEKGGRFLVCGSRGGIYTAEFRMYGHFGEHHYWHKLNSKSHYCEPTHWMPLPEPPKGE